MEWILDHIVDYPITSLVIFLVTVICLSALQARDKYQASEKRTKWFQMLRQNPSVQPERFPSNYKPHLSSEALLFLHDYPSRSWSIAELKAALIHIPDSEQLWEALNVELKEYVQGLLSSEAPVSAPGNVDVYRLTEPGKSLILAAGITPTMTEKAQREFFRVQSYLLVGAKEAIDPVLPQLSTNDITDRVIPYLERICSGFLESYAVPLAAKPFGNGYIRQTWLAHRLRECWSSEFIRTRNYAIDLCESRGAEELKTAEAIANFDRRAGLLEDTIWNESMLLFLSSESSTKISPTENVKATHLLRPMSLRDKALLRDILAAEQRFVSQENRDSFLSFVRPEGFAIQIDISGAAAIAAGRVVQTLLNEPLVVGDKRLEMLKNLCTDVLGTPDLPEQRRNELRGLVERYSYLWV